MAVKRCAFPGHAALGHILFEAPAKRGGGLTFTADADGEMPATREDPDIAFEMREELDVDALLLAGDVIPEGGHRIIGPKLRPDVAQRIAGAGRDDAEIGIR